MVILILVHSQVWKPSGQWEDTYSHKAMSKESQGYDKKLFKKGAHNSPWSALSANIYTPCLLKTICASTSALSNRPSSLRCDNTDLHKYEKLCLHLLQLKLSALLWPSSKHSHNLQSWFPLCLVISAGLLCEFKGCDWVKDYHTSAQSALQSW